MFDFLKRFFAPPPKPAEPRPEEQFRRLNAVAPLRAATAGPATPDPAPAEPAALPERSFVCREAVLNRDERIVGYEFTLNQKLKARLLARSDAARRVYDDALLRHLDAAGVGELLGHRLAIVQLSPLSLGDPLIESLPPANIVLLIDPRSSSRIDGPGLSARLEALGALGFRHGWLLRQDFPGLPSLLAAADFVEVETTAFDGLQLSALAGDLRRSHDPARPLLLIARDLRTYDEFNLCFKCGFDYFQGPFVASRDNWHMPKSDINRVRVLELLNMVRSGVDTDAVSAALKLEPVVSFKLLRYINSPALGMQREITSLAQGLTILGRDNFYRWLSLLLFDSRDPGYRERLLTEQALTRARFMESLAGYGKVPDAADHLFMTGLFSLLDVLMGQSMPDVMRQVVLPAAVHDALLAIPGPFRDCLRLAMTMESNDPDEIAPAADDCAVDDLTVSRAMIEANAWAQSIAAATEP